MSSSAPKISIGIPTYRGAQTLGATLASVLADGFDDFEVIVTDDGQGADAAASRQVVEGFGDARLHYHANPSPLGVEANWNRCLTLSRGQYFKLLPHDDLLRPGALAATSEVLDADEDERVALVFSAREVIDVQGRVLASRSFPGASEGILPADDVVRACVRRGTNVLGEPGGVLMRRALALHIGGFDASQPYVIDLDYWLRLLAHGDAYYIDRPLAAFRVSREQWSVALGKRQAEDFRNLIQRFEQRSPLPTTAVDRWVGRVTPSINQLARRVFFSMMLR